MRLTRHIGAQAGQWRDAAHSTGQHGVAAVIQRQTVRAIHVGQQGQIHAAQGGVGPQIKVFAVGLCACGDHLTAVDGHGASRIGG